VPPFRVSAWGRPELEACAPHVADEKAAGGARASFVMSGREHTSQTDSSLT
jgi:hypothetical protein